MRARNVQTALPALVEAACIMTWPAKVKRLIEARSGGVCEGCGKRPATEMHHRKYKSRGGKNTAENALHLCGWGNHTGCHGEAHTNPERVIDGWSVNSWDDPASKPVLYRGVWVFLLPGGGADEVGVVSF